MERSSEVANQRLQEIELGEGVRGAAHEEHRHADVRKVVLPQLIALARWVKRVGEEEDSVARVAFGDEVGSHAAAHRPSSEKEPRRRKLALHPVGDGPPASDELRLSIGALLAFFRVEEVEAHGGDARGGESFLKALEGRRVHVAPGAVGDDRGGRSFPEAAGGYGNRDLPEALSIFGGDGDLTQCSLPSSAPSLPSLFIQCRGAPPPRRVAPRFALRDS